MELIRNKAESHFIETLAWLEDTPQGWCGLHFSFSRLLDYRALILDLSGISAKLETAEAQRTHFVAGFEKTIEGFGFEGFLYAFEDLDVFALLRTEDAEALRSLESFYQLISASLPAGFSDFGALEGTFDAYQKFAERKVLSAKRQETYSAMGDRSLIGSLAQRRREHAEPQILVVEDDRFTAHYASSILGEAYKPLVCRTGEEAVSAYIHTAPDIVFMDIHLPGLSGHEALEIIHAVDPEAFVVMLSADAAMESVVRASAGGASKFLKKPFARGKLVDLVENSPHMRARKMQKSAG
ncbi:MAG: response regulator [Alphaproteobacteria bacterium]|nr:response regulator [Alphaproteobacteria bacterium]